ncbi:MAG: hypothetical protein J6U61_06820 [Lachnospiraceae bacterium]|nr:hypothetical protein [Lachnospiraceae bacterium]
MSGRRLNASATVEAAYIVPFVFFVTIALIVLILMLYDRMKLCGDFRSVLEYGRIQIESGKRVDADELKRVLSEKLTSGYLLCDVTDAKVTVAGEKITVSAVIVMRSPAGIAGFRMPGISKVMSYTVAGDRERKMRLIRAGREIIEGWWNDAD